MSAVATTSTTNTNNNGNAASVGEKTTEVVPFNLRPGIEDNSSWLSFLFMTHLSDLFARGSKQDLYAEDLGGVSVEDRTDRLYAEFCKNFDMEKQKPKKKRSLWSVLFKSTGRAKLVLATLLFAISSAFQFGPVLILTHLVRYFAGLEELSDVGLWVMVALLFVCPMVSSMAAAHSNRIMAHIGCQVRNIIITSIYRKSLTISPSRKQAISTGRILTMFSGDTNQIRLFLYFVNNCILAPFQLGAALYLIYREVNVATFVGLGYQFFTIPIQMVVMKVVTRIRQSKMKITDKRVKLLNEVLNGIRIIKYYAWENAFIKKLTSIRYDEIRLLMLIGYFLQTSFAIMMLGAPQIQSVLIFWTYTSTGNQLDAAKVFTVMALFGLMSTPFIMIPYGLQLYNTASVSTQRIMDYLCEEDITVYLTHDVPSEVAIEFTDVNLSWVDENEAATILAKAKEEKPAEAASKESKSQKGYSKVLGGEQTSLEMVRTAQTTDGVTEAEDKKPAELVNRAVYTLSNVNVRIRKGQLVGIVGAVGSGKSSFLAAILGEMYLRSGTIKMDASCHKSIAYCDQRPWIVNATVKENILFGSVFEEAKFERALRAAAMEDDLKMLPDGLNTEIGERGINLSGGQKARVSLARAVYSDAEMYLLDDPLSAVDAHVGEHIFQKCLVEELSGKTRLLVTHHSHVLPRCDYVIILNSSGLVLETGTYRDIENSGVDISHYITEKKAESVAGNQRRRSRKDSDASSADEKTTEGGSSLHKDSQALTGSRSAASAGTNTVELGVVTETVQLPAPQGPQSAAIETLETGKVGIPAGLPTVSDEVVLEKVVDLPAPQNGSKNISNQEDVDDNDSSSPDVHEFSKSKEQPKAPKGALIVAEERATGKLSRATVAEYIQFGGILIFTTSILLQLMSQVLNVEANFWLSNWGHEETLDSMKNTDMSHSRTKYWMNGFAGLQIASVFLMGGSRIILTKFRTTASVRMHESLLSEVLFFPIAFFDVTPIGRVINRFSQDMATIDEDLPQSINQLIGYGGGVMGAVGGIIGATKGTFLILFFPLMFLYSRFQAYFAASNTSIARIEAISRSPIYADFSQTLSGTNTIRAYGQQHRFITRIEGLANENTVPGVLQQIAVQWLSIRLDFVGATIMLFLGALSAGLQGSGFIPAGYLGLSLSYAITMTGLLKLLVRGITQVEAQFNSVDRISYYVHQIPTEHVYDGELPPSELAALSNWPEAGVVEFQNVSMGYRGGDLVLKDVSFTVNSKDKVGIAGRTGCGKSSLMVTLFRIEELRSGRILIDDIDISKLPLNTVRSKLCIIPQDPVMFSDTVRFNVDPFDEFSDSEIWQVLRDVNMHDPISALPSKLQELVAEGGDNFSAGQRQVCASLFQSFPCVSCCVCLQLVCIARALLRRPKILVMDEATASIDQATDSFIQEMIRVKFTDCTVLTIAHRLETIIDGTKVLVMDAGRPVEFDEPAVLLARKDGVFRSLWDRHKKGQQAGNSKK
jgi:ABC-type multidrug transport system fused ATPase/permease subunit